MYRRGPYIIGSQDDRLGLVELLLQVVGHCDAEFNGGSAPSESEETDVIRVHDFVFGDVGEGMPCDEFILDALLHLLDGFLGD